MTSTLDTYSDSCRILLTSTDPGDLTRLRTYFERDGYRIVACPTIAQLVKTDLGDYDLILMELPDDITLGVRAIETIKQSTLWSGIPLLVFSPSTRSEILVRALNAGADDYIIKPFSMRELGARVRAVLRSAARRV